MIRAQCIVHRGDKILLVKHRMHGAEWWCLPGGGVEPGETPKQAAIRELREECSVNGRIIRQTSHYVDDDAIETVTFLVDIGVQEPHIGADPEFDPEDQILAEMRWSVLAEIPERDRAYLWAAGLMSLPLFLDEVSSWGDDTSYPGE